MNLISEYFVKPKHDVLAAKEPIYLTPLEICMLGIHPIQRGLLYDYTRQQSTSSVILNIIDTLKESLSIALVHFYPLAGRFVTETFTDEHACSVFIDCNKGPGARLTHVLAPGVKKIDILSPNHVSDIVKKFFEFGEVFFNYECDTRPLLSIQVTELVDGVFIGFTMNHSVVDGTSIMHFLSMLSEIFCSNNSKEKLFQISRVPVYEHGPCFKLPIPRLEEITRTRSSGTIISPLTDRVFHFSPASMTMIKGQANNDMPNSNVSSLKALSSLIWRSITRARNLSADQETACCMVINTRPRLDPKLSDNYFGNCISQVKVISKVYELLGHDYNWAAMRLNDGIEARDDKSIRTGWNWIAQLLSTTGFSSVEGDIKGPNGVVIGGSPRFDIYGLEFGLGKAVAVRMGPGNKTDGRITAHPGCEGNGSVDLEITLKEEHMASLEMDHEFMSFIS